MEEDIKILEELTKGFDNLISYNQKQAIENLIKRYKQLEKIVKVFNATPNDYMSNDIIIVIADREYFNNGILKENCIPKSKIEEKIKELEDKEPSTFDAVIILKNLIKENENHIPRID